jgi:hypothetical protein
MRLSILFLFVSIHSYCQLDYSEHKGEVSVHNYSAIAHQDEIIGYNVAVKVKSKKESFLSINLLDRNADIISKITIQDANELYIIETSSNGNFFAVLLLNIPERKLQTRIYNLKGKEVNLFEKSLDERSLRFFTSKINQSTASYGKNKFLHEIDTQGFFLMYTLLEENLYTCNIFKIDSNSKSERFYTYMSDVPIFDAKFLGSKQKLLLFSFEKVGKDKNSFTADIIGVGMDNFDQQFEIKQNEKSDRVFIPNSLVSGLASRNSVIDGRFYFTNNEMINQYHDGIGLWEISPSGELITESYSSFQKDFIDLKFNSGNKSSEVGYLFPHKSIGTADGKIYIVSEGYKKVSDGVAMMQPSFGMMGGGYYSNDFTKIKTTDIVISEFRPNLKYRSSGVFEKKSNTMSLDFYEANSIYRVGDIFNRNGLFDFLFAETDKVNGVINIYFKDYNRNSSGGIKMKVTKLIISKNDIASFTFEKQPNTSETYFLPLNYGNLMIMEYINRRKTMYFDIRTMK